MRERALLLTPVVPDPAGGGPAQRAFQWACRLAARFELHVLVVHRRQPAALRAPAGPWVAWHEVVATPTRADYWRQAARAALATAVGRRRFAFTGSGREWAFVTPEGSAVLEAATAGVRWARVVAFRIQMFDYADALRRRGSVDPATVLIDFDDVESVTRRSLAEGLRRSGRWREALVAAVDARYTARVERQVVEYFPRVAIASPADRSWVAEQLPGAEAEVFPNRLWRLPERVTAGDPRRILFLGTLGYFANQEAVQFLADRVLPRLRAVDVRWRLVVGGYDAPDWLAKRLGRMDGVEFKGPVASVADAYGDAGMVAAPLFSGGGTKIKVLEALGHGCALIATEHAVQGLSLRPSVDFWPAENVDEWVNACTRLAADEALARELGASGRAAIAGHYVYGPETWRVDSVAE